MEHLGTFGGIAGVFLSACLSPGPVWFVVMLPAHAPEWVYAAVVVLLTVLSATWHCGRALVFSVTPIQAAYRKARARIDTLVGAVQIVLGVRLAVSR